MSSPVSAYPDHLRVLVEEYLHALPFRADDLDPEMDPAATDGLVEAMRYSLLAGGKRIRPVLCLATCAALGRDPQCVLPVAAAIELIHTYSLIHDDLPCMDDDDLRRGRPTCHKAFGEDVAILAGDALFAEAVRLVSDQQPGDPALRLAIVGELVRASSVTGMVGGQFLDLRGHGRLSPEALRQVHHLKTGRLIAASVDCAVRVAQPDPDIGSALHDFSRELGLLFQIVDDILDVAGDETSLGKPVGGDARHDKVTYVSFYGLDRARQLAAESHRRAGELLGRVPGPTADLRAATELIFTRHN
jgi:geranylgeranyl diphosphate synthase type II